MEENRVLFDERHVIVKVDGNVVLINAMLFEIENEINSHGSLKLKGTILTKELEELLYKNAESKISVELMREEEARRLVFSGFIISSKIYKDFDGTHVELEAKTLSYKLDKEGRFRSYQDVNTPYQEIVSSISKQYPNIAIVGEIFLALKQRRLLVQFNETDWDFINRIASLRNKAVFSVGTGIKIGFGGVSQTSILDLESCNMWIENYSNETFSRNQVKTDQIFLLGEQVEYEKEEEVFETLTVIKAKYSYHDMHIVGEYTLLNPIKYKRTTIENRNISGKAIEARIVEVVREGEIAKLTVNFNQELKRKSENPVVEQQLGTTLYQFPYVTPYSKTHTGYYCTPEMEDNVIVYFPNEIENTAYIIGCVNNVGNIRFSDRYNRNFIVPGDSEGADPHYNLVIQNGDIVENKTNHSMMLKNDFLLEGTNNFKVASGANIVIESTADMQMTSGSNIQIKAESNFEAEGSDAVNLKGKEFVAEGDSAASIKAGSDLSLSGSKVNIGG